MPADYLHNHKDFAALIRIVASEKRIDPALVEKDYWIMHGLYGLQQLGLTFELKGRTSLSKGFKIIDRFSEDLDVQINPSAGMDVKTGRNQTARLTSKAGRSSSTGSRTRKFKWTAFIPSSGTRITTMKNSQVQEFAFAMRH